MIAKSLSFEIKTPRFAISVCEKWEQTFRCPMLFRTNITSEGELIKQHKTNMTWLAFAT